jgi:hypothetical protein
VVVVVSVMRFGCWWREDMSARSQRSTRHNVRVAACKGRRTSMVSKSNHYGMNRQLLFGSKYWSIGLQMY